MNHPKVVAATPVDEHTLIVQFDNNVRKKYDVSPLLDKPMFFPLRDSALFRSVKVEQGGYAVYWNSEIDISEHELWSHGESISW